MKFILEDILKNNTKDKRNISAIISIAAIVTILAAIIFGNNYKMAYKVTLNGSVLGYVNNKEEFTCMIKNQVLNQEDGNMEVIILNEIPQYSPVIVSSSQVTNEASIIKLLKLKAEVTYKVYAVTLNGEDKAYVDTMEQAQAEVNRLTEQYKDKVESEFGIREVYTNNMLEYKNMRYATITKFDSSLDAEIKQKEETARIEAEKKAAEEKAAKQAIAKSSASQNYRYVESQALTDVYVNGIAFTKSPVTGNISSRYGANESIRNHTHKGLDIAASNGTSIFAVANGTVTYAGYNNGGYGNLVIISHGNGVETYYAHCSKLFVTKGQTVTAGTLVGAVGSTGNSTGNHLHFEIRINGQYVNPQNYIYK